MREPATPGSPPARPSNPGSAPGLTLGEIAAGDDLPQPEQLVRVVALDGPAGTGKSSVARGLAAALGWRFVDTGATYRAVTLAVLRAGADPADAGAVLATARSARIDLGTDPQAPTVWLDDTDVSAEIRSPAVTAQVSAVSAVPAVRALLIAMQRRAAGAAGAAGAVVEGRDIATVVAPRAAVKVYLDARAEVRARRRAAEPHAGVHVTAPAEIERLVGADLVRRDALDSQTNLLAPSDGAHYLDTSDLDLAEVVATLVTLVRAAGPLTA